MSHFIFIDESGDPGKPFTKTNNGEKVLTLHLQLGRYEKDYSFTRSSLDAIKKAGTQTWDTLLYIRKYI